jgi:hypothetical protein
LQLFSLPRQLLWCLNAGCGRDRFMLLLNLEPLAGSRPCWWCRNPSAWRRPGASCPATIPWPGMAGKLIVATACWLYAGCMTVTERSGSRIFIFSNMNLSRFLCRAAQVVRCKMEEHSKMRLPPLNPDTLIQYVISDAGACMATRKCNMHAMRPVLRVWGSSGNRPRPGIIKFIL